MPADQLMSAGPPAQRIGRRMVESKQQVPHFYITSEYDVAALLRTREQVNGFLPERREDLGQRFHHQGHRPGAAPVPQPERLPGRKAIVRHGQSTSGVAVAVEGGLLTVVCRDADRKPLRQISAEIEEMAARARRQGAAG